MLHFTDNMARVLFMHRDYVSAEQRKQLCTTETSVKQEVGNDAQWDQEVLT